MTLLEKIKKVNELISSIRGDVDVPYIDIVDQENNSVDLLLSGIGIDDETGEVKAYGFYPMPFK